MSDQPWLKYQTKPTASSDQPWLKYQQQTKSDDSTPTQATKENSLSFPADDPKYEYGNILPLAENKKTGDESFAAPEFIRAPVRGALSIGRKILSPAENTNPTTLSPDEMSTMGLFVGGAAPIESATNAIGRVGESLAAKPSAPIGGLAREQTDKILKDLSLDARAAKVVERRVNQDISPGGTTAQDIVDKLNKARAQGKPAALLDAGPNAKGLAGSVSRRPGSSQAVIKDMLEKRDTEAASRLTADVQRDLTGGSSAYRTTKSLLETRQAEAQPLYDKAFQGRSLPPIQQQLSSALKDAQAARDSAASAVKDAEAKFENARNNRSLLGSGTSDAYQALQSAQRELGQASATQQQIEQKIQGMQGNQAASGAVWSPRIQQFLDDPVMKRGMSRGMEIQRLESLAAGKRFDPTEMAMTPEGEVVNVPNMRTLDAGKKGLDAIIESEGRDEFGRLNQMGRAVNQVRLSLLGELDKINPDYKAARSAWSSHSASMDAVKFGKNITRMNPEQIAEEFGAMTDNDKEFARIGAADSILERLGKTGFGGDEAKSLIKNEWAKGQMKPLFRSEDAFKRFVDSVATERGMFETKREVLGNSSTASRMAEDENLHLETGMRAVHGVSSLLSGDILGAAKTGFKAYRDLGLRQDPELNERIAHILTDIGINPEIVDGKIVINRKVPFPQKASQ